MIRYDRSPHSIVVTCTCGWREVAVTKQGAWRVAAHHEELAHPDRDQVRAAQRVRDHRSRNGTDDQDAAPDSPDDPAM